MSHPTTNSDTDTDERSDAANNRLFAGILVLVGAVGDCRAAVLARAGGRPPRMGAGRRGPRAVVRRLCSRLSRLRA